MKRRVITALALAAAFTLRVEFALAQACPEPFHGARHLVLVTTERMAASRATMQLFERGSATDAWRPIGAAESVLIGRAGMGWGHGFHSFAQQGEPRKVEGDGRTPAGVYRIGRTFGFAASPRPDYIQVSEDTVCVDDPSSSVYNMITSRRVVGAKVRGEDMRKISEYRRGLVVDYPTDAAARSGSCIFIHLQRSANSPTAGCIALPEARLIALQEFTEPGAVLATVPRAALGRFTGCLPQIAGDAP